MTFPEPALFKLGAWPVQRLFTIVLAPFRAGEAIRRRDDCIDMLSVVRPVGRDVQDTVVAQPVGDHMQEYDNLVGMV